MRNLTDLDIRLKLNGDTVMVSFEAPSLGEESGRSVFVLSKFEKSYTALLRGLRDPDMIRQFGTEIFDTLFPGPVRFAFSRTREYVDTHGLRLYLYTSDPVLANVPWELAYDRSGRGFLALDRQISFIRHWSSHAPQAPDSLLKQLRILAIFPSPEDLAVFDVRREAALLQNAIEIPLDRKQIHLQTIQGNKTLHRLEHELSSEDFHVLHFSGHGDFDPIQHTGLLAFEDESGQSAWVTAEQLRVLLGGAGIRLATVIAADSGSFARIGELGWRGETAAGEFHATAPTLIEAGIPTVIALQSRILDRSASSFVRAFYSAIADRFPIDLAVVQARRAIYLEEPNRLDWIAPVLYASGRIADQSLHFASGPQVEHEQRGKLPIGQSISNVGGGAVEGGAGGISQDAIKVEQKAGSVKMGDVVGPVLEEKGISVETIPEASIQTEGLDPADIAQLADTLKSAVRAESNLSPRERVDGIALIEQLDYQLSTPPTDRREIARLVRKLTSISPKASKETDALRLKLGL